MQRLIFFFFKKFHNTLIVKSLSNSDSPCQQQDGSEDPVGDSLIAAVGNISKLRKTNLSMADKRDFLSYYASRNTHKKNK